MGNCFSGNKTHPSTAKLILHNGRLLEFPYSVRVSHLLHRYPTYFICDSDEMDFDAVLPAIDADEDLEPGHIYFALPLSCLRRPFKAEEMAALAVKANSALAQCCSCVTWVSNGDRESGSRLKRRGGGGGSSGESRGCKATLNAIPE